MCFLSVCVVLFLVNQAGNYIFQFLSFLLIKEFNVMDFSSDHCSKCIPHAMFYSVFSVILFIKVYNFSLHPRFIKELVNRQLFCFPCGMAFIFIFVVDNLQFYFISIREIFIFHFMKIADAFFVTCIIISFCDNVIGIEKELYSL